MAPSASALPGTLASLQISAKGLKTKEMRWQLEMTFPLVLPSCSLKAGDLSHEMPLPPLESQASETQMKMASAPQGRVLPGQSPLRAWSPCLDTEGVA